jgi:cathepsin L
MKSCKYLFQYFIFILAVQLVGYGTDPQDGDYWLLRNSWGNWWGDAGYIKLKRTSTVECGTNSR